MTGAAANHPIAQKLHERQITTIALIDDAFDPPTRQDVATALPEFWAALEENDEGRKELFALLGRELTGPDEIDDAVIQAIRSAALTNEALKKAVVQLMAPFEDKLKPLNVLRGLLSDELKCATLCHGQLNQLAEPSAQMVFVDYYMGPGRGDEMVKAAKDVVKDINALYGPTGVRPVIVLMSSQNVSPQMIEDFRESSGWLGGMFFFINKDDFRDPDVFFMRLVTFAQAIPAGHKIQALIDALSSRIHDVASQFVDDLKGLHLSDYAYLQMMSLQEDGHPLGDYMLWLCGSYIGQMLFGDETVRAHRRAIDQLVFSDIPAAQAAPTDMLARLYECATVEPVDSDMAHPRAPEGSAEQPHLHLGDLFVARRDADVLMIINAQCDLEFAPGVVTRPFRPDRAILLIPGKLQPLREAIRTGDQDKPRTEVFHFDKEYFRIIWDPKRVRSINYGGISDALKTTEHKLVARLRLPFALLVQQAFAADLTRVGLPTAPPIQRSAKARLLGIGEDGKAVVIVERDGGAYLFATGAGLRCVITDDFVLDVKASIDKAVDLLGKREAFLGKITGAEKQVKATQLASEAIKGITGRYDVALRLRLPFTPPEPGDTVRLSTLPIEVQLGGTVTGSYRYEQPLLLHLSEL